MPLTKAANPEADGLQSALRGRSGTRLRVLAIISASYTLDTVLLSLFALVGTVSWRIPALYFLAAAIVCGVFYFVVRSPFSDGFRDRNLSAMQMATATAIQLGFITLAPNLAMFFLAILFIVFAFGTLRLTARQSVAAVVLLAVSSGVVLRSVGERVGSIPPSSVELTLLWLSFLLTLARVSYVGTYGSAVRRQLHKRNEDLAHSVSQIGRLASHDELTGTLNRRSMSALIEEQIRLATRGGQEFCVAMLDLDHFKAINDRYGHVTGDDVLRVFGELAGATMRVTDRFARYGGEEFVMLLPATPLAHASGAVERVRAATAAAVWDGIAPGLSLSVSAGIAAYRPGDTMSNLIGRADAALYDAKRSGRNRLIVAA